MGKVGDGLLLSMDLKRSWEPVRAAPQVEGPVIARLEAVVYFRRKTWAPRKGHRDGGGHAGEIQGSGGVPREPL